MSDESPIFSVDGMSDEHRRLRRELLDAEIALTDQRERVAELRRALPLNPVAEDYLFVEGFGGPDDASGARRVPLSQLFSPGIDTFVVYHFMFSPNDETPCPMCTMWADGFDGVVPHLADRIDFAVVARAPIEKLRAWGKGRGWSNLRMLSSSESAFNRDFGVETPEGDQLPGVSVFVRGDDEAVSHAYTGSALQGNGHFRGVDLLTPVWSIFDLTPAGRGEWMPKLAY